ncbi:PepSY domain-containing protein [Caulobacter sp. SSI4214]|uniref:PepSY domain-containing protein n=1 Tax=Caulobacter sp. SSI4214 TaxID=2575739 RepID=UPI001439D836|nr:PepSY domain-containing protein [Caulobacter sp. SSI4214]
MRKLTISALLAMGLLAVAGQAAASPTCTKEPQSKWLPEAQMRAKIAKMGYTVKVFQISGSCYEIYGRAKDGKKAEVYFNPVTGEIVRNNEDD